MSTRFTTGTVIDSTWLNQVDDIVNTEFGPTWTGIPGSWNTTDNVEISGDLTTTGQIIADAGGEFLGGQFFFGNVVFEQAIIEHSSAVSASNIVPNAASVFYRTLSGPVTFTFTPDDTDVRWVLSFTLEITNSGGAQTITWPASVKWPSDTIPTATAGVDVYTFYTRDEGTTWRGALVASYTS